MKQFLLKKAVKKQLVDVKEETLIKPLKTIGLIVDERHFVETSKLIEEIITNKIIETDVKIIAFRNSFKNKEVYLFPTFGLKDLNRKGEFKVEVIDEFILEEFDLLINYYDEENPFLLLLTNNSKAKFKAGFASVDKRLNHLSINIGLEDYKGFTHELFRYLKILNKI